MSGEVVGKSDERWYILSLLEALVSLESHSLPPVRGGHLDQPCTMWRDMAAVKGFLRSKKRESAEAAAAAMAVVQAGGLHSDVPPPPMPKV